MTCPTRWCHVRRTVGLMKESSARTLLREMLRSAMRIQLIDMDSSVPRARAGNATAFLPSQVAKGGIDQDGWAQRNRR